MRKSIEKLAWEIEHEDGAMTLGELAEKYGETTERIMDAIDVLKIAHGQPTQLPPVPWGE